MVFVNHDHERLQSVLSLQALLCSFSFLLGLFLQNGQFGLVRFLLLINFDLGSNQVSLDPLNHVLVLSLLHHLKVGLLFDLVHFVFGVLLHGLVHVVLVLDEALLVLLLFESSLQTVELFLFGFDLAVDEVVLLAQLAHRRADFFYFFAAALPRRDHVVGLQQRVLGHKVLVLTVLSLSIIVGRLRI